MVQGYYTLHEAAEATGLSEDELKQRAQRKEIRSFQDRGTLRFRIQDVQELQRQLMGGSDPDLQVPPEAPAEAPRSGRLAGGPKSGPKTPTAPKSGKGPPPSSEEVLDFELDESIDIGREPLDMQGSSARSKSRLGMGGPKSGPQGGPKTPKRLTGGSDSDVKLVADASARNPNNTSDSDVRLDDLGPSSGAPSSKRSGGSSRRSKQGPSPADSGVRLVPMADDEAAPSADEPTLADQPIGLPSDGPSSGRPADNTLGTEEMAGFGEGFDADDERRDARKKRTDSKSSSRLNAPPKTPKTPKPSPFELSEDGGSHPGDRKHTDFELPPPADADEDFSLELSDDSLDLGAEPEKTGAPASGINLGKPSDKGISLESKEGSSDFDLTVNEGPSHKTPKPVRGKLPVAVDESDFELTLDYDEGTAKSDEGSGEFELSLDDGSPAADHGSSEFELTLDDGGAAGAGSSGERDIFETDFELPALDEGSEEATIDAGSSDFELALDDSDIATDEESGSQVIALDESEYADDGEQTVTGDYGDVEEADEEGAPVRERVVVEEVVRDRWIRPAPWGVLPMVFMLPCTVVMILIGIMTFEMLASGGGFKSSGVVTKAIAAQILPENQKTK